jgi:hypothetical protein
LHVGALELTMYHTSYMWSWGFGLEAAFYACWVDFRALQKVSTLHLIKRGLVTQLDEFKV